MTSTAIKPRPALTAEEIDDLAQRYEELKRISDEASDKLAEFRDELRADVDAFGAASGEKSKKLTGVNKEIVVSYGTKAEVNDAQVLAVKLACQKAGSPSLFKKLFDCDFRHRLRKGAQAALAAFADDKPKAAERIAELFSKAVAVTATTPTVKVRNVEEKSEK